MKIYLALILASCAFGQIAQPVVFSSTAPGGLCFLGYPPIIWQTTNPSLWACGPDSQYHQITTAITNTIPYSVNDPGPNFTTLTTPYDSFRVSVNGFPVGSEFGGGVLGVVSAITGAVEVPSSAASGAASVSGYARTNSNAGGAVGVLGMGFINANGSSGISAWGSNFLTSNCNAQSCATNTGFTNFDSYGSEIDTNILKSGGAAPNGNAVGLYLVGGSEIQPTGAANAITIDPMGIFAAPVIPWKNGLNIQDGSASASAINIGTTGRGVNSVGSMSILLNSRDGSGNQTQSAILADPSGDLIFRGGGQVVLEDSSANVGLQMFPNSGTPYIQIPNIHSTTGQRFVCVDTSGRLVSSASACVGT